MSVWTKYMLIVNVLVVEIMLRSIKEQAYQDSIIMKTLHILLLFPLCHTHTKYLIDDHEIQSFLRKVLFNFVGFSWSQISTLNSLDRI